MWRTTTSIYRLVFLSVVATAPAIPSGMSMAIASVALPQLLLSIEESSWFASISSIAIVIGNLTSGCVIDRYGRRVAILLSIFPNIVGWFLMSFDVELYVLYIARLLTGFSIGASSLPSAVYTAECISVNNLHLRESIGTWTSLQYTIGTLLVFLLGSFMTYQEISTIAGYISVICAVFVIYFIPESPTWLYNRGRIGDAEWSQNQLRIRQPILTEGSSEVVLSFDSFSMVSLKSHINKLKRKDVYKPLLITTFLTLFLQFSGFYSILSYGTDAIDTKTYSKFINPYLLAGIATGFRIIGNIVICFFMSKTGIRKLMITTSIIFTIGMALVGLSIISCAQNCKQQVLFDTIRVFSILAIFIAAGCGFASIPYSIIGEVFPTDAKGFASITFMACSTFNFIILKIHPYIIDSFGGVTYLLYALFSLSQAIYVYYTISETVGKPSKQIKTEYENNKTSTY